jgi:hypothetical protein
LVALIVASVIHALLTNPWPGAGQADGPVRHRQRGAGGLAPAHGLCSAPAMLLIAPVAIILVAENLGHQGGTP